MMIICRLDQLMAQHKINLIILHEKTGINAGTLSNLYHHKTQRIDLSTVEKLCEYFQCQVNELFEFC